MADDFAKSSEKTLVRLKPMSERKREVRKLVRSVLAQLTPDQIASQSSLVMRNCMQMSCVEKAKGVAIFLSRPQLEVSTTILCQELGKQGVRIYVPYMASDRDMEMLELNPGEDIRVFERDKWGIPVIPEPEKRRRAEPGSIDIVFTPGVAFDLEGRRLGNGKGYYDRFFHNYDTARVKAGLPRVVKYGLALEQMILRDVPVDEHDVILDGIIAPLGVFTSMHC